MAENATTVGRPATKQTIALTRIMGMAMAVKVVERKSSTVPATRHKAEDCWEDDQNVNRRPKWYKPKKEKVWEPSTITPQTVERNSF